jgi:hypothetical protein
VYIDNVIIHSNSTVEEEHLQIIKAFLELLSNAKLTIYFAKSEFCRATLKFLVQKVGQGHVKPIDAKVQAVIAFFCTSM